MKTSKPVSKAPKPAVLPVKVNTDWFQTTLQSRGITQRKLAKALDADYGAVSRMLHGRRRMQLDEATEFAKVVGVPLEEVLANAGINLKSVESASAVPVVGWVDASFSIHMGAVKGPKTAPAPGFGGKDTGVVRFATAGTPLDALDGALAYYRTGAGSKRGAGVDAGATGKLCVVQVAYSGEWRLRIVRRGYQAGRYNLALMDGRSAEEEVQLDVALPVLWLKM